MSDSVNLEQLETEAEAKRQNYLLACAGQLPQLHTSANTTMAQYLHQRLLVAALEYAEAANRLVEAKTLRVL